MSLEQSYLITDIVDKKTSISQLRTSLGNIPGTNNIPKDYDEFIRNYKNILDRLNNPNLPMNNDFKESTRQDVIEHLTKMIGNIQDKLNSGTHYDQRLRDNDPIKALSAGIEQLGQDKTSEDKMYKNFLSSRLKDKDRVICLDFATFSADVLRKLGFTANTFIINTGVQHMATMMKDPKTGEMYIITAEGAGGKGAKIIKGNNQEELRENYQNYLLSVGTGRTGNSFGGAIFKDGKFTGYALTMWEKTHEALIKGSNGTQSLIEWNPETKVDDKRGIAGGVEYNSTIATYYERLKNGETLTLDMMTTLAQHYISTQKGKETGVSDVAIKLLLEKVVFDDKGGFSIKLQFANELIASYGQDNNGRLMAPDLRGQTFVGTTLNYSPEGSKWSFKTTAGQTYEWLNPSQYHPGLKFLPSGELVMMTGTYNIDPKNDVLFKIISDHNLNKQTDTAGVTYQHRLNDKTVVRAGVQAEIVTEEGVIDTYSNLSVRPTAGVTLTNGNLSGSSSISLDPRKETTKLDTQISYDLRKLLENPNPNKQEVEDFFKKFGITVPQKEMEGPKRFDTIIASFYVSNQANFKGDEMIITHFANLGLTVTGSEVFIKEGSSLYNTLVFKAGVGVDTNGLGITGSATLTQQLDTKTQLISKVSANFIELSASMTIKRAFMEDSDGTVYKGVGNVSASSRSGLGGSVGIESVGKDGNGEMIGIGLGVRGLTLNFGTSTLLMGGSSQETIISLGGIRNESSKNAGNTVADGTNIIGNNKDIYQYLSKDPKDIEIVKDIIKELDDIGSEKGLTLTKDFMSELKLRSKLLEFKSYLTKNKAFLKHSKVKSLHFQSTSDWLGMLRNTNGTQYDKDSSHLIIRSIDNQTLDEKIFDKIPSASQFKKVEQIQKELSENGIIVKSNSEVNENELNGITNILQIAKNKQQIDRVKNMTINLIGIDQQNPNPQMNWDETNRVLTLPISSLNFTVPNETEKINISGLDNDKTSKFKSLLTDLKVKNINDIEVIKKDDKRFLTTDGQTTFEFAKNINGTTYIYEDGLNELLELHSKKDKGFFDKINYSKLSSSLGSSSIHLLNVFDKILEGEMSDKKKDIANVGLKSGSSTLYEAIPTKTEKKDGIITANYEVVQANNKEKKHTLDIKINNSDPDKRELNIKINDQDFNINPENSKQVNTTLKQNYPEIFNLLYGLEGTDVHSGKKFIIEGIIANLISKYKMKIS